jgi:Helix-turn-helix domain
VVVIGRRGTIKPFQLIRWARAQALERSLRPLEAHLLLVLATYANAEGVAWPSIATLARDAGLKVKVVKRRDRAGRVRTTYENSAVSAALAHLQQLGLIWRTQHGPGRPGNTELLFNPSVQPETKGDASPPSSRRPNEGADAGKPSVQPEDGLRESGGRSTRNDQGSTSTPKNDQRDGHRRDGDHERQSIRDLSVGDHGRQGRAA